MKLMWVTLMVLVVVVALSSCGFFSEKKAEEVKEKTIFTFLGAPGSGKGTVAEQCVKDLGFATLSTGNLLRGAVARGDELGKQAEGYMKAGKLVPDELVTSMVENWLNTNMASMTTLILDGYPRTAAQADLFLKLLKTCFADVKFRVIEIAVPDDAIVNRLADRVVCENKDCQAVYSRKLMKDPTSLVCEACKGTLIRREDDKEEVVRERLKVYAEHAGALMNVYKAANVRIDSVNAENKNMAEVFAEFKKIL